MITTDVSQAALAVGGALAGASRVLVLTHVNPDGDAIGSMLGVWHALRALGKDALPLASSALPSYALWLPGADQVAVYRPGARLPEADLVVMVDTASLARVGAIYDDHAETLARLPVLIIDHHVTNEGAGLVNLIDPSAASCCELVYRLLQAMRLPVGPDTATCLLLGLTTDTQSFQTSSTSQATLETAAALLGHGADQRRVVHEVYFALPASSAALIGLALSRLRVDGPLAWTTVTQEMIRATGAEDEGADEVVRVMQRIAGVRALVLFKERADGQTKLSLRSRPPLNVANLALHWGGGGHAQAAGATLPMGPQDAEAEVLPLLRRLAAG